MPLMVDTRQGRGCYCGHKSKFIVSDGGWGKGGGCSHSHGHGHGHGVLYFTLYLGSSNKFEWNHCCH